jgi:hypothetical protein
MSLWSERDLRNHYNRAKSNGWLPHFDEAAELYDFDEALLLAIGSRETNMRNIMGDGGHGAGLMQIDDRSFPDWHGSDKWKDPRLSILKGAEVLAQKRDRAKAHVGKAVTVKGHTTTGKPMTRAQLLRVAIAGYNSGDWGQYHFSEGHDPDRGTTGQNYSADVLRRAEYFRKFLRQDGLYDQVGDEPAAAPYGEPAPVAEPALVVVPEAAPVPPPPDGATPGQAAPPDAAKGSEAIVGGRPQDPPVQAAQSLWKKLVGWISGTGITYGAVDQNTQGMETGTRRWVFIGFVVLALVVLIILGIDHLLTKYTRSRPDRYNIAG